MHEGCGSCRVCGCVCVPALAAVYIRNQRYSRVFLRRFLDFDSWIFKSYDVKSQYANKLELTASRFAQVGKNLLQRLDIGATGVKQAG